MANLKEIEQWEEGIYQIEKTDPVVGGEDGVTNKPIKQLANRTLYLRKLLTEAGQQIQPKKITGASKNSVDLTGHTHEIESASTSAKGLVQLTNDTGLDSEVLALTAKAGKALAQSIAQAKLDTTNGLNKKVDKTSISDAVDSTSQTTVASSRAAKTAYDKGVEALNKANTKADSVNPILTTNKWYADMDAVPDGTLFFAINHTTLNQQNYNQGAFDAQAWQFDVGIQKVQMIFYAESDIKVRYNDDGVNWSDWTSFLTERNLSAEINNSSDTVPASVAGVKLAYDRGTTALNKANDANANAESRLPKSGGVIDGFIRTNATSGWSKSQWGTSGGFWEVQFNSDDGDKRFNFVHFLNGISTYINFPAITSNEIVAYRSWVNQQISGHNHSFNSLTNIPATFTPSAHKHPWSDLTGIPATASRWPTPTEQGYSHNLSKNGWTKLPSGLILQWGEGLGGNWVTFPIAFNECFKVFPTDYSLSDAAETLSLREFDNTRFRVYSRDIGAFMFFAIGR